MGSKELEAVKKQLSEMKKIDTTGFTNTETAKAYFEEKEIILEGIVKAVETITAQETSEVEALKSTVKELREGLKVQMQYPKEMTQKEFFYKLGRGVAASYRRNNPVLAELGFSPNLGTDKWTNPKDVNWVLEKGWVEKAASEPMGDMSTSDQYLIHPSFETELVAIAEKKSVMMPLVESTPMTTASVSIPVEEQVDVNLEWLNAYGSEIHEVEKPKVELVKLEALTCAGYVTYYDEFEEDSYIEIGKLFVKKFIGSYAREFDKQCLVSKNAPFTGALETDRAFNVAIKGNSIDDLTYEDFRDAVLKVPAEERKDCCWFLHETVVNQVMNLKDNNGNPIVRRPMEKMPGVIDLYPYHECHVMPQFSDIEDDTPFAVFMNPQRINHRNRKGIEIRRFDGTNDALKFGIKALRFRKRDAFGLVVPKNHMVILKTKA
ncbi:MAG: phage major capsid protein [Treponema sp.]|jgi:HK97 family phage major capsid protein|nr:phage major capsid protein [Treponema sp.]